MVRRVRLHDVLHSSFAAEDPALPAPLALSNIAKDDAWLEDLFESGDAGLGRELDALPPGWHASPHVIRFSLRRDNMIELGVAPLTMARAVDKALQAATKAPAAGASAASVAAAAAHAASAIILYTPRASRQWVLRVRLVSPRERSSGDWYHETQQLHVHILRKACANQAHTVDWATAGRAEFTELDPATDTLVTRERWVVQASGSSLASMSRIRELDWSQAHVNDITMAASVLGLEAANALMYEQLVSVMTNDGSYIDTRHLQLLADGVMHSGEIMPVRRHGVLRKKTGWAHRASFEEIMNVLSVGAAKGEYDNLRAASGAVMSGQMGAFGSGWVGLHETLAASATSTSSSSSGMQSPPVLHMPAEYLGPDPSFGAAPNARFVDGRTGKVQHRAVHKLRRLHDARASHASKARSGASQNPTGAGVSPTPVPMAAPATATPPREPSPP
jgi:hypothetical protein